MYPIGNVQTNIQTQCNNTHLIFRLLSLNHKEIKSLIARQAKKRSFTFTIPFQYSFEQHGRHCYWRQCCCRSPSVSFWKIGGKSLLLWRCASLTRHGCRLSNVSLSFSPAIKLFKYQRCNLVYQCRRHAALLQEQILIIHKSDPRMEHCQMHFELLLQTMRQEHQMFCWHL